MNFDVESRTILLVRHGSHAYGLATPASDVDQKGVCIEPKAYHLGFLQHFEQQERLANKGHEVDSVIYSLKKFVRLAAECNPNIIEVLHVSEEDVLKMDSFGQRLRDHRNDFMSRKAMHTFSGYAFSQIKRIKSHRQWLLRPPTHKPTRTEFQLPEQTKVSPDQLEAALSAVKKKLQHWKLEDMSDIEPAIRLLYQETLAEVTAEMKLSAEEMWKAAARSIGFEENFLQLLNKERAYRHETANWNSYQEWLKTRNPARAKLEMKYSYDTKHGSHCLRLMRMCKEILEGKGVIVKRPDAEELLAVKLHGTMRYDDLMEETERLIGECKQLYNISPLPHSPDRNMLDRLVVEMTEQYLSQYG
jgi:predicted nucleotidyltransferase